MLKYKANRIDVNFEIDISLAYKFWIKIKFIFSLLKVRLRSVILIAGCAHTVSTLARFPKIKILSTVWVGLLAITLRNV